MITIKVRINAKNMMGTVEISKNAEDPTFEEYTVAKEIEDKITQGKKAYEVPKDQAKQFRKILQSMYQGNNKSRPVHADWVEEELQNLEKEAVK